ncbi:MAG TPA: ABC transporter ATP-binding protein [Polyangiaceae bacterium]|nr:ABC transporter ATP-binding protein [Polyangiaceae bacterium]
MAWGRMDDAPLLRVRDLVTTFRTDGAVVRAVDGVSFDVPRGTTVALVGESGCGKSVTALSILRLVASPPGRIVSGSVELEGRDLLALPESAMRDVRGNVVSMIFQEPMTSLNPVYAVGWQITEGYRLHKKKSRREARARAVELLRLVGIPEPETTADAYPHQLSGGQRQRVMIAMALACEPKLLLADEPTTALDVTIQAQILALLGDLQQRFQTSILLITHDLGLVAEHAREVVVMYAGRVVERAGVRDLFARPMHPYTRGLLESIPRPVARGGSGARRRLHAIEGLVPDPRNVPPGCRFADRCPMRIEKCTREEPPLAHVGPGRESRCWRADEVSP